MDWARVMVPMAGGEADRRAVAAGAALAEAFQAELRCVHAPADVADLIPWMGDGFMGGAQATAVESIRQAGLESERSARALAAEQPRASFISLESPVWAALAMESRLSDVVVFDDGAARGKGSLADAFQQIVAGEQRPTLVAKGTVKIGGTAALAWDGGKEASRAMRTALPLLQKASRVIILTAPAVASRRIDPALLQAFLAARGVTAELQVMADTSDPAPLLLKSAKAAGADILVAGAFGHPRLQEFIFGGATRTFLASDGPSLFLSH